MARRPGNAYVPRSLYGRAALILLVPVLALMLLVSVVFIQRHYSGVTEQMTRNVALELRHFLALIDAADRPEDALADVLPMSQPLRFQLALPAEPPEADLVTALDFSGRALMRTMRAEIPQALRFDVTINRQVWVWIETRHGPLAAMFDRRRVSASNPHQLLVLMVASGLFLSVIAMAFLRSQLRPIDQLASVSEAFGRGHVEPFRPSGAAEVRAAGRAFLAMRTRIERQIEQRTMMLSGVSHDLRTPITRLKLGLEMQEPSAEVQAMLRDVADMERLVDEFLAFARGDSLDDAPEDVDATALLRDVAERYAGQGDVRFYAPEGALPITLRPLAVTRAVENLISNGIKYGRQVLVSLAPSAEALRVVVEDDGPGIPAHLRGEAMKPFVQLEPSRNQDRGSGVGLGLAIAHDIARRHGGGLELRESADLGGLRAELVFAR